jgi:hypothetical protein
MKELQGKKWTEKDEKLYSEGVDFGPQNFDWYNIVLDELYKSYPQYYKNGKIKIWHDEDEFSGHKQIWDYPLIESEIDNDILEFIENNLWFITLNPRVNEYDVLANTNINYNNAKKLAEASENCWKVIINKDVKLFGFYFKESFDAQVKMFPNMVTQEILDIIELYKNDALGWKLSGAGGGGYLIIVSDKKIKNAIQIRIVRKEK